MRIYHNQLGQTLSQSLANPWLVFGDEIWQRNDALWQIKQHAQHLGFSELIQFSADDKFDWQILLAEINSLSLFASQKVIEVELVNSKVNEAGNKALAEVADLLNPDTLLILHGGKLDTKLTNRSWFKKLSKQGCYLPVYPLEGKSINRWLQQQSRQIGLKLDSQVEQRLIECYEGNLPALQQELQKLSLLFPQTFITLEMAEDILFQQSKFSPFQLADAMLQGNQKRCGQIIDQLQQEGIQPAQIIWILHKELKQLHQLFCRVSLGENIQSLYKEYNIWDKRKPLYDNALNKSSASNAAIALNRLMTVDQIAKTDRDFDEFILLKDVIVSLFHGDKTKHFSLEA